jgi:cytochrome c oxidase assembly factor CtaG
VWHVPAVYDAALRHQGSLLHLEHLSYFVTGCLFWWPALRNEPHRLTYGARAMYLFAAFVVASPLGLMLALIPRAIYDYYVQAPGLWGLSPLTDQQIGGGAMALEQAAVLFAVGTWFFLRFLSSEGRADTFRTLGTPPSVQSPREMSDGR